MSQSFDELVAVMAKLRAPGGCPWDHEQTYASLAQYLLEEAYETFDAIQEADQTGDTTNLKEELGDLLLQVVFHSTIGDERSDFNIDEVCSGVTQKLVLRHPHVFGDAKLAFPLGVTVGLGGVFSMVVLSFWIGAGVSLILLGLQRLLKRGKPALHFLSSPLTIKSEVPFAPFLILGFLMVQFLHADIFNITYSLFFTS
mgnify:CR=1 FL=1